MGECTEVRVSTFLSSGFITGIVLNPPERKLAKRTSVKWGVKTWKKNAGIFHGWLLPKIRCFLWRLMGEGQLYHVWPIKGHWGQRRSRGQILRLRPYLDNKGECLKLEICFGAKKVQSKISVCIPSVSNWLCSAYYQLAATLLMTILALIQALSSDRKKVHFH